MSDLWRLPQPATLVDFRGSILSDAGSIPAISTSAPFRGRAFHFGWGLHQGITFDSRHFHQRTFSRVRFSFRMGSPSGDDIRFPPSPPARLFAGALFISVNTPGGCKYIIPVIFTLWTSPATRCVLHNQNGGVQHQQLTDFLYSVNVFLAPMRYPIPIRLHTRK